LLIFNPPATPFSLIILLSSLNSLSTDGIIKWWT
jgi:hypothetical protein